MPRQQTFDPEIEKITNCNTAMMTLDAIDSGVFRVFVRYSTGSSTTS
jgi:hypothetical protein